MRTRDEVIALLVARGVAKDRATMYADCWLEYQTATENIEKNGVIVQHPRTGQPLVNPYVPIRDGALKKLDSFRGLGAKVQDLW